MSVATGTVAIETSGLTKRFGQVEALSGLDLQVPRGSVFGFLGPNGSGKTTTLSILAGLARATSGEARICGFDVDGDRIRVRQSIGFLRQDPRFYNWMTGRETLQFTGRFFAMDTAEIDRRAAELLELVDLAGAGDRRMGGYSGGMRQRLGIAQALMGDPQVLLLDEPCAALDPAGRLEVIHIMERLRGSTTVFFSTHILQDVERVADEVAIVSNGRRIRQAKMTELLQASASHLVLEVEGTDVSWLTAELARLPYVHEVELGPPVREGVHRIRLEVGDIATARRHVPLVAVAHDDLIFVSCRPEQQDLEAVFLELTGGESGDKR